MSRWTRYDKSRWQQDRERFHLADRDPAPAEPDCSIQKTILDVFSMMNAGDQCVWRQVEQAWKTLVGPMIARHARPVRLDRNILMVAVDSSVWLNELVRFERSSMLSHLQQQVGKDRIQSIKFKVDPQAAQDHIAADKSRTPSGSR